MEEYKTYGEGFIMNPEGKEYRLKPTFMDYIAMLPIIFLWIAWIVAYVIFVVPFVEKGVFIAFHINSFSYPVIAHLVLIFGFPLLIFVFFISITKPFKRLITKLRCSLNNPKSRVR